VDLAGGSITGTAVELTGSGHLVVETETGRHEVAAGDAVHLRPADAPFSVPPGVPGGAK
jgi:BirA family biotin operon repressor/biotin-[acetyl-CoA-carboxylase] ligase